MKRLIERGERIAHRAADGLLSRAAEAARETVPRDVSVDVEDGELRLGGRGLGARSIEDPRLRALGPALRELLR